MIERVYFMKYISISPLINLLNNSNDREHFKKGDLEQLENKINNLLKNKISNENQKHSAYVEEEYLYIIKQLKKHFIKNKKLSRQKLIEGADKILNKRNFNYTLRKHRAATDKFFLNDSGNRENKIKCYDIAFYNKRSVNGGDPHHSFYNKPAVYYMRCEEFNEQLLIGNLQIDCPNYPLDTKDNIRYSKIKINKKNIYAMMIQSAVKYGLSRNYKKIMFQCGDAVEFAQWRIPPHYKKIKITEKNINHYKKLYKKMSEKFDNLKIGDSPIYGYGDCGVVVEKLQNGYKCYDADVAYGSSNLMSVILNLSEYTGFDNLINIMKGKWDEKKSKKLLIVINKIFKRIGVNVDDERNNEEKIKFLHEFVTEHKIKDLDKLLIKIDDFFFKFNYDDLFLKNYKNYKKIDVSHNKNFEGDYCFVNPNNLDRCYGKLSKKFLINPELGQTYRVSKNYKFLADHGIDHYDEAGKNIAVMEWYDDVVPKILKKLKLDFNKTAIRSYCFDDKGKKVNVDAHALEITGGVEEFKSRPLLCFSGLDEFKMDTVSLPKLLTAAKKFGVSPEQINIINDLIIDDNSLKHAGVYNRQTDDIHLANQSLSILAHECIHSMAEKKLIPKREYNAMVKAGKCLAQNSKKLNITQSSTKGKLQYQSEKERNEEYAAIFVEKYYEREKIARKYLTGDKITACEKILNYVKETYDVIKAHLGDQPARAKSFLRKVEKEQLFNSKDRQKHNIKNLRNESLVFQEI